jgi:DNA (cytosine-5)-methyltransferase 1
LRGYLETGNKKRKSVAGDAGASAQASRINCQPDGISGAVTSKWSKGSGGPAGDEHYNMITQPVSHWEGGDVHPTLNQSAKGSGGVGSSNQELFSQGGAYLVPGQPTPFRKSKRACSTTDNETWVPADASNTLKNFDLGDTRTTHAVVQPVAYILDSFTSNSMLSDNPNSGCREVDVTKCLDTSCLNPACHQGGVMITQPAIPIHDQATRHAGKHGDKQDGKGNGLGIGKPGDPMNTLTQGDKHAVAYHTMPGSVAPTIGASGPPYSRTGNERVEAEALAITFQPGNLRCESGADPSFTTTTTTLKASAGDQTPHVAIIAPCITASNDPSRSPQSSEVTQQVAAVHQATMAVRRLTPVECERLQGFPDNWSRICWKGKPEEECPDGPRYKACGNSMAVPVMRWIGERIAAVSQL